MLLRRRVGLHGSNCQSVASGKTPDRMFTRFQFSLCSRGQAYAGDIEQATVFGPYRGTKSPFGKLSIILCYKWNQYVTLYNWYTEIYSLQKHILRRTFWTAIAKRVSRK